VWGPDSSGSEFGPVAGSCCTNNKTSSSTKSRGISGHAKRGLHSTVISSHNHKMKVDVKKTNLRLVQTVSCLTRSKNKFLKLYREV
jgi:hypothetical protein